MFEISLLSNWLVFFQTCDVWDLPSSKWNGFGQYFMVLIRNCSVHSWHLNFSPQIASVQTLKWPSAIASRPFESLHWCNFGEKFKCHSCDGTISTKIICQLCYTYFDMTCLYSVAVTEQSETVKLSLTFTTTSFAFVSLEFILNFSRAEFLLRYNRALA